MWVCDRVSCSVCLIFLRSTKVLICKLPWTWGNNSMQTSFAALLSAAVFYSLHPEWVFSREDDFWRALIDLQMRSGGGGGGGFTEKMCPDFLLIVPSAIGFASRRNVFRFVFARSDFYSKNCGVLDNKHEKEPWHTYFDNFKSRDIHSVV